jgi:NAD(P)-dependent dehydrogenase (short-subunit alcohol dehydrogenase family)
VDTTDLTGRTVLVTGAGSGIGRSLALLCARRGARLVICDLDHERLASSEQAIGALGGEVLGRRVDVTDREGMDAFAGEVHESVGPVDLLVNNAGVGMMAGFCDTGLDDWDWIVSVNLMGVVNGLHRFLPPMVERRSGHVVNLASMAAYAASPVMPAYTATKYAVLGLSESLSEELRPVGIGVTAACPGIIDTSIITDTRIRGVDDVDATRARINGFYRKRGYGPDRVAESILKSVGRGRTIAPVSHEAWFGYGLKRLSPRLAARAVTRSTMRIVR